MIPYSPVKILLVDDLPENLFALELILSKEPYFCVRANSGNEALKILLREQDFAIILIDVQMPEMDGFETVELIREIEALKQVPIIFLTASMDNLAHVFKGYQAGAVDYMIKPLIPEILKAKVAVFVDLYKKTHELLVQKEHVKKLYRDVIAQKTLSQYAISLIEASHDPLFAINSEGKITDMNDASVKIIGVSREELINTNFFDYFTNTQKAHKGYEEVFAKGSIADFPLTFIHKNGKLTDVLFNGSVYKDDNGNVLGIVIVARDVTLQNKITLKLLEAKKSAELATEIAEEAKCKAESAKEMAEDIAKGKQQFLSNMSHEIRTPMNAIIGFTKVMFRTDLSPKQKEFLTAIKTSGDTLIVLINDILDLAKVEAGKMTFVQKPFKLSMSISAMLHLFETKIQEKNLELIKEYDDRIPEVLLGDPVRLHQIILNLLSNAVKFTVKGKITVNVQLLNEDEEKVTIEFRISDTGIGVEENKLEKIFENFQQAATDTSSLYGGTGLGLAIVKNLVEAQGGSISIESKIGKGSTFGFRLIFQKTKDEVETETETETVELDSEIKKIKVLVVEDILLNQLLIKTLLNDYGFECGTAVNGKIAIEKLETESYDIILMDLQMPEMNGIEATEYIRKKLNSKIPIIALTADVTTINSEKCQAMGMNDYLAKPVDEELLYKKIIGLLKPMSNEN